MESILTNFQFSRQQQRYSTLTGSTPTIPVLTGETMTGYTEADNMVLGNFNDLDLLDAELFVNTAEDRVFIRSNDKILEFILSGGTFFDIYTSGGTWNPSSNLLTYTRNDGNTYSVNIDEFSGLTVNGSFAYVDGNQSSSKVLTSDANGNASWQNPSIVGNLSYFFKNTASDIPTYLTALDVPQTGPIQTITNLNAVDNQLLATFATASGGTGVSFYPSGIVQLHIHAANTNSGKQTALYYSVYLRTSGGTETLLGTSSFSDILSNISSEKTTDLSIGSTTGNTTDRVIIKVYASITGGGAAPHVDLYIEDSTLSRVSLPSIAVNANNFVPYSGATNNLNLGSYSINAGTILSGGTNINTLFSPILNASNGINITGTTIQLGGILNQNTVLSGDSKNFEIGTSASQVSAFKINAIQSIEDYTAGGSTFSVLKNPANSVQEYDFELASGTKSRIAQNVANITTTVSSGTGATRSQVIMTPGVINILTKLNGGSESGFVLDEGSASFRFTDSRTTKKGLEYQADYSTGYTSLSLITKGDLDNAITGATLTASNGITKTLNDIKLGGTLNTNTTILGANNSFELGTFASKISNATIFTSTGADIWTYGPSSAAHLGMLNNNVTLAVTTGGTGSELSINAGSGQPGIITLGSTVGANNTKLVIQSGSTIFTDTLNPNSSGIQYATNYSSGFTSRSLIDKQYVDNAITGATVTASNGLTKTGNDIKLGGTLSASANIAAAGNSIAMGTSASPAFFVESYSTGLTFIKSQNLAAFTNTTAVLSPTNGQFITNLSGGTCGLDTTGTSTRLRVSSTLTGITSFEITTGSTTFTDASAIKSGIEYAADYSSGYTSLSLITKGDLDAATSGFTGPILPSFGSEVDLFAWGTTTGTTPTNLLIDTTRILVASNQVMSVVVNVSAVISDGSKCLNFVRKVAIKNVGGTTTLVGTVSEVGVDVSDDGAYLVNITADNTNDALDISVTGKSGETIKWLASLKGTKNNF